MTTFFSWLFAKLKPKPFPKPTAWVSWYRPPLRDYLEYLAWAHDEDQGGFYYTRDKSKAYRFETEAAARRPTPVYDGSDGIEARAGVEGLFE